MTRVLDPLRERFSKTLHGARFKRSANAPCPEGKCEKQLDLADVGYSAPSYIKRVRESWPLARYTHGSNTVHTRYARKGAHSNGD